MSDGEQGARDLEANEHSSVRTFSQAAHTAVLADTESQARRNAAGR